ncbi:hypothetical protein C7999DRAFT_36808 [Corynascus novoguineensis]|uniref:Dolichyl-diphosphooligosaccharide--protein glycosyltransferase subunit OST2 n=1 Tax=Corynascus novoguineensis TaxID=1126955 RepID=A0AAN7D1G0_9PEZI|nr:hypothetical protein C7999DRAFT_36808 [Corynascus novoguineensis]
MAPKHRNAAGGTSTPARSTTPTPPSAAAAAHAPPPSAAVAAAVTSPAAALKTSSGGQTWDRIAHNVLTHYLNTTPQRTKLLDAFMAFLVAVGALQFAYCVLAGNYPFNAFLSGFSATVGQFVLTASLRIQTTDANKGDFPAVSPERAFADYVVCSLILHFFCVNFIN